jgi:hypothetical protein
MDVGMELVWSWVVVLANMNLFRQIMVMNPSMKLTLITLIILSMHE